jgi:hypothetical protein
MPVMPACCPHCSEPIRPAGAKFCPRCGKPAPAPPANGKPAPPAPAEHSSIDFGKMSAPLPPAGIAFLASLVLAPAAILLGVALGLKLLIYAGVSIGIVLVILLVLGHFF